MIEIWHNPRCSKSRAALKLLEEAGAAPRVRRYLDDPPDEADLRVVCAALGGDAISMMRPGEKTFRELGLSRNTAEDRLFEAMAAHPVLIERPIVQKEGAAVIARPPEAVLTLL